MQALQVKSLGRFQRIPEGFLKHVSSKTLQNLCSGMNYSLSSQDSKRHLEELDNWQADYIISTDTCNTHHSQLQKFFICLIESLSPSAVTPALLPSVPRPPLIYFLYLWICLSWTLHIKEITRYVIFWD